MSVRWLTELVSSMLDFGIVLRRFVDTFGQARLDEVGERMSHLKEFYAGHTLNDLADTVMAYSDAHRRFHEEGGCAKSPDRCTNYCDLILYLCTLAESRKKELGL